MNLREFSNFLKEIYSWGNEWKKRKPSNQINLIRKRLLSEVKVKNITLAMHVFNNVFKVFYQTC